MVVQEDPKVQATAWEYAFGSVKCQALRAAVELGIPDLLEQQGSPISLPALSAALDCHPQTLYRLMRFLSYHGMFKTVNHSLPSDNPYDFSSVHYAQSALSSLFTSGKMAPFMYLGGPVRDGISADLVRRGKQPEQLKTFEGEDTWKDPEVAYQGQAFTDSMAYHARLTMTALIQDYAEGFKGIGSLVDVGGLHGMAIGMLVEAFPEIRGICFDLPKVVETAPQRDGVEFVGGSMFDSVPKADAVMLMWVLHDWSDEACIDILMKCKEAVPAGTGKVIILDAIIDEGGEGDEFTAARLAQDMMMMAVTVKGKERTYREWVHLLNTVGFSRHTVKNIKTLESVIEAYP